MKRVRNWRKYNEALVSRGSVTFWFDEATIENWHTNDSNNERGRPRKYSDMAIRCGLTLKAVFNLTFRAVEGFIRGLLEKFKLSAEAPDYTLLCKRQKSIEITLPKAPLRHSEKVHILVDSTGMKVFGEGEWKVRQHGYIKHRLWRKLHLAVNSVTQEIEAFELTELGVQDCEGFSQLVKQMDRPIETAIGDGSFDRFSCYEAGEVHGFKMIAPPQKNARTSFERTQNRKKPVSRNAINKRDEVIKAVRHKGLEAWKSEVGYHRRSLAETAVFRIKTILGNKLRTKLLSHQRTEMAIWCRVINKITALGFGTD